MSSAQSVSFEEFLAAVSPECKDFVSKAHEGLISDGYKLKIEFKASGPFASYSYPKTKRSILNFFFRKSGFFARIYVDNASEHADFLNSLPDTMEREIAKSSVCKRMLNPAECNPKCAMGYDFYIRGDRYQKCRYSCFQFAVNTESMNAISTFIENEQKKRAG